MNNKKLDALLASTLLSVPTDFTESVMNEINQLPVQTPEPRWKKWLHGLAVLSSVALGTIELLSFIFGMWTTTTAY